MKISLKWLCDFVDVSDYLKKPEPLAEILTRAGLEVEDIQNRAKDYAFVVTGIILKKEQHPNADKLSVCQVMTGEGIVHQIVCGAKNHKENDKVVAALPGAILPGNFAIQKTVLRGVDSGGMLCSTKELGVAGEDSGIMILPADTPIGLPFAQYAGLEDVTFELKVTPNRADCLSHFGLSREIACLLGRELKRKSPMFAQSAASTKEKIALEVQDTKACPRYAGRFIAGVKIGATPAWLKARLESVGMKSINNVVDVTNYVMMELGQPLHAFDANEIKGKKIIVRKSEKGEAFKTLDGTELKLTGDELVIADQERAVAMAGVIGGLNSGVSDATQDIFLESAYFQPATVRRSSRRFGINTDSCYRFVRGVDPEGTRQALDRATELLLEVAGGEAYGDSHDVYPEPVTKQPVTISTQMITDRLGYPCDAKVFEDWMRRLGCDVKALGGDSFEVLPPTFRFDLEMQMDLVEEYARLNGYDHIPESFPALRKEPLANDPMWNAVGRMVQALRAQGFSQASNYAFVGEKGEKTFLANETLLTRAGFGLPLKSVRLRNPLSEDWNVMRRTLTYGLYKNVVHNFHQGQESGMLFEVGPCFGEEKPGDYREEYRVAGILWGEPENMWVVNKKGAGLFKMKAALEAIYQNFWLQGFGLMQPKERGELPQFLHRGQAGWVMHQARADEKSGEATSFDGYLGSIHPQLLDDDKIRVPVTVFELTMRPFATAKAPLQTYRGFSRQPAVTRDLSLVMPKTLAVGDVMSTMREAGGELLKNVSVFDVFEGGNLEPGQKSVSFRLRFQDKASTLQDEAVLGRMTQVLDSVKQKWGLATR
ncbi:MAG: phenylalanine--tRNA ligase subunit beta [Bdellovibrionaceae bacterium]|nr:phenylalanine--tRNA ligase subunit beta [Pseudobdellovibrionaceae bacterium]